MLWTPSILILVEQIYIFRASIAEPSIKCIAQKPWTWQTSFRKADQFTCLLAAWGRSWAPCLSLDQLPENWCWKWLEASAAPPTQLCSDFLCYRKRTTLETGTSSLWKQLCFILGSSGWIPLPASLPRLKWPAGPDHGESCRSFAEEKRQHWRWWWALAPRVWRTTVGYMQLLLVMKILTVHPNVKLKIVTCWQRGIVPLGMRSFSQKPNYWNFWHTQIIFKAGNLRLEPSWGVCGWQQARESLTADGEILIGVMPIPSLGGLPFSDTFRTLRIWSVIQSPSGAR